MIEQMIAGLDARGWHSTLDLTAEFAARLKERDRSSFVHYEMLVAETHMSASTVALSRGLRYVFESWRPGRIPYRE
jgi:hypothetical protein